MREWNHDLGVVDTIYEEEGEEEVEEEGGEERKKLDEEDGFKSLSVSPSLTTTPSPPQSSSQSFLSPPPSLHNTVEEWSRATGYKTDVVVRVRDRCFHLHRDPLISRSGYLRRHLTEQSSITISPPSTITAETFAEISVYCYTSVINLTPSNIAAVKIAAECLEMDDDNDGRGNGNLTWLTEDYFRQEIAGDATNARYVLHSCAPLLPESAPLAVKCVEALAGGDGDVEWMEELTALTAVEFGAVAESMRTWFPHDHDLLYRIVDRYLQKHKDEKVLTEEEKSRICSNIDCTCLSHNLLLHLVQNPRLPLRFVVQAMLVDQLHTRHTVAAAAAAAVAPSSTTKHRPHPHSNSSATSLSLGTILQRDAALRQASHLRASMEATAFRIDSLERDLEGLRRRLRWSEEKRAEMESARSSSFRITVKNRNEEEEAVKVGGKSTTYNKGDVAGSTTATLRNGTGKGGFGRKLMNGLKNVFRASSPAAKSTAAAVEGEGEDRQPPLASQRRNNSFTLY